MALNENIKSRRMQLKMSQEYVADQLGISRQAVAKWESVFFGEHFSSFSSL